LKAFALCAVLTTTRTVAIKPELPLEAAQSKRPYYRGVRPGKGEVLRWKAMAGMGGG